MDRSVNRSQGSPTHSCDRQGRESFRIQSCRLPGSPTSVRFSRRTGRQKSALLMTNIVISYRGRPCFCLQARNSIDDLDLTPKFDRSKEKTRRSTLALLLPIHIKLAVTIRPSLLPGQASTRRLRTATMLNCPLREYSQ